MKTVLEVIKFNEQFPERPGAERRSFECHCGNAFVTETVDGKPDTVVFGKDCHHTPKGIVTLYPLQPEGYECNDKLFNLIQSLRDQQKKFFAARAGSVEKLHALAGSRACEKEIDKFIKERNEQSGATQPDLFTL
jgi:hypothetical protein